MRIGAQNLDPDFLTSIKRYDKVDGIDKGRLFSDMTDFVVWYGNVQQDTAHNMIGTSSLKITPDATNTTAAGRLRSTKLNLTNTNLMVRMYIEDVSDFSNFEIRFSSVDNMASYMSYKLTRWMLIQGWNEFMIPLDKLTTSGTGTTLDTINTIQVSVTGSIKPVWIDAIYTGRTKKPSVLFHFDDGWKTQYTNALPIMRANGLVGSVGIISDSVGTSGYLSLTEAKRMYILGWDMFNHSKTHLDFTTISLAEVEKEIETCKEYLIAQGMIGAEEFVAYPYGSVNDDIINLLKNLGYTAGRTTREVYEVSPSIEPYKMKCVNMYPTVDINTAKAHIDHVIANNDTVVLLFHKIEDETNTEQVNYPVNRFEELVKYIAEQNRLGNLDVLTWSEYFKK